MGNRPVNFVAVVGFFLSEYCPDMKTGDFWLFFHKPLQKDLGGLAQGEKLVSNRFQAVADCLCTVDTCGVKSYHRSGW